jgi:hypothetical protein
MTLREIWDTARASNANFVHNGMGITCKWDTDKGVFVFSSNTLPIDGWEIAVERVTMQEAIAMIVLDKSICFCFDSKRFPYFEGSTICFDGDFRWMHSGNKWGMEMFKAGEMVEIHKRVNAHD